MMETQWKRLQKEPLYAVLCVLAHKSIVQVLYTSTILSHFTFRLLIFCVQYMNKLNAESSTEKKKRRNEMKWLFQKLAAAAALQTHFTEGTSQEICDVSGLCNGLDFIPNLRNVNIVF